VGWAGADFRNDGDARWRADGRANPTASGTAIDHRAARHREAPGGSEGHHSEVTGPQGVDPEADHGSKGDGSEVARSQEGHREEVHQARGGREEGRGDQESEDRARPQSVDPEADHRSHGNGAEVARSQEGHREEVHEARGGREEGRGFEETVDRESAEDAAVAPSAGGRARPVASPS